jgi:aminoglycoside phosphotransferase (APT) family kinase protein
MAHDPTLDPQTILKALDVADVRSVSPISGGTDTSLWRVEHARLTSALRVYPPDRLNSYLGELRALELAGRHGVPVPEVRRQGSWRDRPALLLSWCAGQPLAAALKRQPWRVLRLGWAAGRTQALIHRIAVPADSGPPTADWIGWQQAADADLTTRLRQLAGPARRLLHLDYHPLNVMAGAGVSAVLDWANAHAGDPRADVARTYTILVVEPTVAGHEPRWFRLARRLLAVSWLAGYQASAGPLRDMPPFLAWAGAVMQADLAPRVQNPASWWQPRHLEHIRRWTERWRQRVDATP